MPTNAQQRVDRDHLRSPRQSEKPFDLLQEQHAPAVDRVARDIHEGARSGKNPYRGGCAAPASESPSPTCRPRPPGFSSRQRLHRRQTLRFRGVVQHQQDHDHARWPRLSPSRRSPPASLRRSRSNPTNRNEKNSPRLWLAEKKSVVGPPLFQRIPARERDDRRGGAHRLRPAVQAPHHGERDEERHGRGDDRRWRSAPARPISKLADGRDASGPWP